jgi:hypothetical protein
LVRLRRFCLAEVLWRRFAFHCGVHPVEAPILELQSPLPDVWSISANSVVESLESLFRVLEGCIKRNCLRNNNTVSNGIIKYICNSKLTSSSYVHNYVVTSSQEGLGVHLVLGCTNGYLAISVHSLSDRANYSSMNECSFQL